MKILALDMAKNTGVCIGRGDETPRLFTVVFKFRDFVGVYRSLCALVDREKPDVVVHEAPILPPFTNLNTVRWLSGLVVVLEIVCAERGLDCVEFEPKQIKSELSGNGNATKPHQIAAAEILGMTPANDDEADAFGAWLCALIEFRQPSHALWQAKKNCVAYQVNINSIVKGARVKRETREKKDVGKKRGKGKPVQGQLL